MLTLKVGGDKLHMLGFVDFDGRQLHLGEGVVLDAVEPVEVVDHRIAGDGPSGVEGAPGVPHEDAGRMIHAAAASEVASAGTKDGNRRPSGLLRGRLRLHACRLLQLSYICVVLSPLRVF